MRNVADCSPIDFIPVIFNRKSYHDITAVNDQTTQECILWFIVYHLQFWKVWYALIGYVYIWCNWLVRKKIKKCRCQLWFMSSSISSTCSAKRWTDLFQQCKYEKYDWVTVPIPIATVNWIVLNSIKV